MKKIFLIYFLMGVIFENTSTAKNLSERAEQTLGVVLSPSYSLLATTLFSEETTSYKDLKAVIFAAKEEAYDYIVENKSSPLLTETIKKLRSEIQELEQSNDHEIAAFILTYPE